MFISLQKSSLYQIFDSYILNSITILLVWYAVISITYIQCQQSVWRLICYSVLKTHTVTHKQIQTITEIIKWHRSQFPPSPLLSMLGNDNSIFLHVQINIDMVGEGSNVICTEKPCLCHIFFLWLKIRVLRKVFSKRFCFIRCRRQPLGAIEKKRYSRFTFVEDTISNLPKIVRAKFLGSDGLFCFVSM